MNHILLFTILLMTSCATGFDKNSLKKKKDESFHQYTDRLYQIKIDDHPEWQTYQGIKKDYGSLEDLSPESREDDRTKELLVLKEMKSIDKKDLKPSERLSYDLFKESLIDGQEFWKWRDHGYPINQMFGRHSNLPAFMINMHRISSVSDAENYIKRIQAFEENFDDLMTNIERQAEKGIIPPKFVFPKVSENIRNLLKGKPIEDDAKVSHILVTDFKKKVSKLKISDEQKNKLYEDLNEALEDSFAPAYEDLLSFWTDLEQKADTRDGAWKLPDGETFYKDRLKMYTTTDMHPEEVHELGLKNVRRIHLEMNRIKKKLGYKEPLKDFFNAVRVNPKLYYSNDNKGRNRYLSTTKKTIARMEKKLPKFFGILPKAKLTIKRVEPFREKSAGSAFYNGPTSDGKRPGIYYVNLYNMKEQPIYQLEALAFHESVPGHHMQISIAKELGDLPEFRKNGRYTAYSEGWALYAERLAKEMGFYKNSYSDFGRLSMELRRACRLVVDTGIHFKRWSREKAIKYLMENTPDAEEDHIRSIERYIVNPGQATAYMVGMLKILELRQWSKDRLGSLFDIKEFHDVILGSGALPLDKLEEEIRIWARSKKSFKKGKHIITI